MIYFTFSDLEPSAQAISGFQHASQGHWNAKMKLWRKNNYKILMRGRNSAWL